MESSITKVHKEKKGIKDRNSMITIRMTIMKKHTKGGQIRTRSITRRAWVDSGIKKENNRKKEGMKKGEDIRSKEDQSIMISTSRGMRKKVGMDRREEGSKNTLK
jgi:hypothetical protein